MKYNTISRSAHADKQLLRTLAPQPDESLMGYILRLSETNYYDTPKWILDLAGLKIYDLKKGWRKLCDNSFDFTLFKQIARLSEEEVNEMKHEFRSDSDYEQCHAQWHVPISSLRFARPIVCSDCLRENPYCRKFNELPRSQRQAMSLLLRSCGISKSERAAIPALTAPFERLGFGDLSRVMLCLAGFVSVAETGMDPLIVENRLLHQSLEQVVAILDAWPEEFHRLCIRHLDKYSSRDLAAQLDRLADRPSLMFLRIAMEEHRIKAARPPSRHQWSGQSL